MKTNFEKNVRAFITELGQFEYRIEGIDRLWDIIFCDDRNRYHHIRAVKSHNTFYIAHIDGHLSTLVVESNKPTRLESIPQFSEHKNEGLEPPKEWNRLIVAASSWLKIVKKNWIKAAKEVYESYPLNRRYGIVPNAIVRNSLPDIYRIDKKLGKTKVKKFIRLVEEGYFYPEDRLIRETMTANDYFEYCRIAYLSSSKREDHIDKTLSGREMYKRYADGRHEGLLEIDPNSPEDFADWIDNKHPKRTRGGHPWEIKCGGNTTHISLCVSRPRYDSDKNFLISIWGASISRLKEAISMFLGIHAAGLPITICDPEGIRKRLLAQDNIGIFPCYHSLHRADQYFHEKDMVYDVLYYDELGRFKRKVKPFINWEPLPILKPIR